MAAPGGDFVKTQQAVRRVAGQIATMLLIPGATEKPIPNSQWTVGEAGAHVALAQSALHEILQGAESPFGEGRLHDFAPVNAKYLDMFREREGKTLAGLIQQRTDAYLESAATYPGDHLIEHHFGKSGMDEWTAYMLFHLLMHGCSIAMALKQPSPMRRDDAPLLIPFIKMVMPRVLDTQRAGRLRACFDVRLRKQGRFAVTVENGVAALHVEPPRRPDCYLSVDPIAFFMVAGGVISQWGPIVKGQMLPWGRRPWLALRFKSMFPNP